jgi:hypothetical protein
MLAKAGFNTVSELKSTQEVGQVFVVSNGGACLFYVGGHDKTTLSKLVDYLQAQPFSGVIFTKEAMGGTFALADAKIDSPEAPDIVVSLRWTAEKNAYGAPGMVTSGVYDYGELGMHVSLSKYDMHNTLIAAGPDFRSGIVDHLPSGNIDVAPTVLWILGLKPDKAMDGRVLSEAMTCKGPALKSYDPKRKEAVRKLSTGTWHQYLNFTELNGVVYLDEGNGWQGAD